MSYRVLIEGAARDEASALDFFRFCGVFDGPDDDVRCSKSVEGTPCGARMHELVRSERVTWRCSLRTCRAERSVRSKNEFFTIIQWWHHCRTTAAKSLEFEPKLTGTAEKPIQIDEAMLAGSAKYKKGRRLAANRRHYEPTQRTSVAYV